MNKITIELSATDRDILERLTRALESCDIKVKPVIELPDPAAEKPQKQTKAKAVEVIEPEAEQPAEPASLPVHTKDEIQAKVVDLTLAGKKAEVKKIVTKYADRVSRLPEDKLDEVWEKLTKLEG